MGKYLQDFMYSAKLPVGQDKLTQDQLLAIKSTNFIADIFSYYLPEKYEVGENIWRIIISLTLDKASNQDITELGFVVDCEIYHNYNSLILLNEFDRKKILLEKFCNGLEVVCKKYNCDFTIFEKIKQRLITDKIVFNDFYKDKKASRDKQHFAQMKGFYSENYEDRQLFVTIFDKLNNEIRTILIGSYNFQAFDKLKWLDNKTVCVYHINHIQSYKSKKVAEDYFLVDIETGNVTYNPVTRESIFNYGVKLLTETDLYNQAINYINQAKELGHGKADNILKNIELDPSLRDKTKLLQTPKQKKNSS